jgi:hypothetical protein
LREGKKRRKRNDKEREREREKDMCYHKSRGQAGAERKR